MSPSLLPLRRAIAHRCHSLFTALLLTAGSAAWMVARAQDVQLASHTPVFFTRPRAGAPAVDASNAAVLAREIAVTLDGVPVADALEAIGREAGLRITYAADALPRTARVTIAAKRITVAAALTVALIGTDLDVELLPDGVVSLRPHTVGLTRVVRRRQAAGTIAGRVTDAVTRAPLDQVSVRVERLGTGSVTGSDGRYTIRDIAPATYRVVARRVGYTLLTKTVTVDTDSAATVDFALAAAPTKLNEVVTTAVGDQRRYEVGNVISTINADSIAPTAPITSLTDLISARAPGVTIEETSGLTGSGEAIRIRGQSSLVSQSDPIVVVDGVRQDNAPSGTATLPLPIRGAIAVPSPSRLNDLDFSDIQSIDVLKGPAASTEYGTDAANGVIVITTKHGTTGRSQWQASAEETTSEIPNRFPTLYYSWGHTTDASHTAVQCPLVPYLFGSGYGSATGTCAVDSVTTWNPLNNSHYSVFGTGSRHRYDLSTSGGNDAVRYYMSGSLSNEIGVLRLPDAFVPQADSLGLPHSVFKPNGENQRSVRTNTAIRLGPASDLAVSGAYLSTYQDIPYSPQAYLGTTLTRPVRDAATGYGYGTLFLTSPVAVFGQPASQNTDRLTGGLTANWRPTPWFVGHSTVGIDHDSQRGTASVLPQITSLEFGTQAQLGIANTTTDIYTVDLRGSATAVLTRFARAVTSVGLQLADTRTQGTTAIATGITTTNFTLNGAVNPAVTQLGNRQATLGGYGEEQLGLSDRLFLTAALRMDAGSGFGRAYSTTVYPKASVSWLVVERGATTVRVRGAFGESGIQPPNGAALQLYAPTTDWLNGGPTSTVAIANVQDQLLKPERSEEYEGGVDLGFWQNRMSVELTGYSKTTRDALVSVGTGWGAGGFPYTENVGEVRNTGVEGALTATVVQARPLTWDVTLNASLNRNKLLALAPGVLSQQLRGNFAVFRFASGYPVYGYWAPRVQYADLNHDGVLEPNEVTTGDALSYAGSSSPTREVSLGTHVGLWSGAISMSALVDYRGGFRLSNTASVFEVAEAPQSDRASNDRTAPLWQQARDIAEQAIFANNFANGPPPAGFYEDATYVRFRELSLTYALPRRVIRALRVQHVSLTGAVRNLALWTRYTGVDPEVTSSNGYNTQLAPTSNTYIVNNNLRESSAPVPLLRYWVVRLNVGM